MNSKTNYNNLREKILAAFTASSDKLIRERMKTNRPLILTRDGKTQKISPIQIAKERWGDDYSRYL
jgi:hypothetical protein